MEAVCNNVLAVCTAIWQEEARAIEWMAKESTKFVESLQMVEDINQMQQDVVILDVGGYIHHLSKQSVTRHRDSFFGALFSDAFNPAEQACAFIDRDGEAFHLIASYLRSGAHLYDTLKTRQAADECAFYCLPQPTVPPHLVLFARRLSSNSLDMIHFFTADGQAHYPSIALPDFSFNEVFWFDCVACNSFTIYLACHNMIVEYQYSTTRWVYHQLTQATAWKMRNFYATTNTLFALDWCQNLYRMHLDGHWKWEDVYHPDVKAACVSGDRFFVITCDTVFIYEDHIGKLQKICAGHSFYAIYRIFVSNTAMYVETGQKIMMCKFKDTVWEPVIKATGIESCCSCIVELDGIFHTVQRKKYYQCPIMADGRLNKFVQVQSLYDKPEHMNIIGVRREQTAT